MASEATNTSKPESGWLNNAACCDRVEGGREPYTTQHLCDVDLSIASFIA